MILIEKSYVVSLLLIISVLVKKSTATNTTTKIISLKYKTQLIENYHTSGSSSFVFGVCDPRSRSWERTCVFAIQTKKSTDSLDHVKICEFKFKANKTQSFIGQILEVYGFGNDKAILTFRGKYHLLRFAVLHFSNCKAIISKIDENLHIERGTVLAADDDMFDIVERKYGKSCGYFAYSKMILDSEGNVVTGLNEWLCNEKPHILAAIRSPLKGYLIIDAASVLYKNVRIAELNQNVTVLKEYSNYETFASTAATSITHQKLSICYQINVLRFNCSQYDHNGELQFETSFEFQHPTRSLNLYNLPNGGFLLLAQANIRSDKITFGKSQPNNLVVTKINKQGELVKTIELPDEFYRIIDFTKVHFHIDENNKYCFSYLQDGLFEQSDKLVNLSVTCLNDNDLTNST